MIPCYLPALDLIKITSFNLFDYRLVFNSSVCNTWKPINKIKASGTYNFIEYSIENTKQFFFIITLSSLCFMSTGDIIITTLPPIPTIGLTKCDIEELMERTYNVMLAHYTQTSKEVQDKFQIQQMQRGGKGNSDKLLKSDNIIDDYANK